MISDAANARVGRVLKWEDGVSKCTGKEMRDGVEVKINETGGDIEQVAHPMLDENDKFEYPVDLLQYESKRGAPGMPGSSRDPLE